MERRYDDLWECCLLLAVAGLRAVFCEDFAVACDAELLRICELEPAQLDEDNDYWSDSVV